MKKVDKIVGLATKVSLNTWAIELIKADNEKLLAEIEEMLKPAPGKPAQDSKDTNARVSPGGLEILRALSVGGCLTAPEVAAAVKRPPTSVRRDLRVLRLAGLVKNKDIVKVVNGADRKLEGWTVP